MKLVLLFSPCSSCSSLLEKVEERANKKKRAKLEEVGRGKSGEGKDARHEVRGLMLKTKYYRSWVN